MLPAPLSKIDVEGDTVAAVTDTARQVSSDQVAVVAVAWFLIVKSIKIILLRVQHVSCFILIQVLSVGDP